MDRQKWRITILVNNSVTEGPFTAEHGLSMMIEGPGLDDGKFVLFDTGQHPETLLHNAEAAGVNWAKLDSIVLSHGHYDHTGGLPAVLSRLDHPVRVIGHPLTFLKRVNEFPIQRDIGTPFAKESLPQAKMTFTESTEPLRLGENIMLTGEIPRSDSFESESLRGLLKEEGGAFVQDNIEDDKAIVIRIPDRGFYLVCGCCHAGMLNTIRYAATLSGEKKLLGIIGGLHLIAFREAMMAEAIQELKKWEPEVIVPLHCTGPKATAMLWGAFGDRVRFLTTGDRIEF